MNETGTPFSLSIAEYALASSRLTLLRLQPFDDDGRPATTGNLLRASQPGGAEVALSPQRIEVDAQSVLLLVVHLTRPDRGHRAEPRRRDIEAHAKHTETLDRAVSAPTGADRHLQAFRTHARTIVGHGDASLFLVPGWQIQGDFRRIQGFTGPHHREEAIDGIVDQLREAAPLSEIDLA